MRRSDPLAGPGRSHHPPVFHPLDQGRRPHGRRRTRTRRLAASEPANQPTQPSEHARRPPTPSYPLLAPQAATPSRPARQSATKCSAFAAVRPAALSHLHPGNAVFRAMCDIGLTHRPTAVCVSFAAGPVTARQKQCPRIDDHKSLPFRDLRAGMAQNVTKCHAFRGS